MCGIVGYIGPQPATDLLLNGLRRLEYRGYDSAGIALLRDRQLHIVKSAGKVNVLAERAYAEWDEALRTHAFSGIAHTRWATHGPPTERNAHPHTDQSGRIAMVHNGIIENYATLKQQMISQGHTFASDTDSEVLAHLIGACYKDDLVEAVTTALRHVEGTFGIAVLCTDTPDQIVVARRGSPLVIGLGEDETLVASDACAILAHTRQVIYLEDNDIALITRTGAQVRNMQQGPIARAVSHLEWDIGAAEKGGYEHFMLKEIFEQPTALENSIRGRLDATMSTALLSGLALTQRELADITRLVVVACGTSLHAGMAGRYFMEDLADLPTIVEQAAEFRYRNPILGARDFVLAISQSGETADTLAALREAKNKGALVAALCNVVGSTIAREAARGVYLHAGPEIGVASTKAFTSQLTVLLMMALKIGRTRRLSRPNGEAIHQAVLGIPDLARRALESNEAIANLAEKYAGAHDFFYLGRGVMFPVALEGALKIKEISYVHAEGYHAAELKHGPIALLDEKVPVVALATDHPGKDKMISNVQECRARQAPVIGVISEGDDDIAPLFTDVIRVPKAPLWTDPISTVIALQLFAYHVARLRGCPIDQPRNLAKSVTVE